MTILIKLPMAIYQGLLAWCPLVSREYAILINSVVVPTPAGDSIVEILSQYPDAKLVFERANQCYPDAAPFIENALMSIYSGEYRKTATEDTWHFNLHCSRWPIDDFVSTHDAPDNSALCNECKVKKQLGGS